MAHPSHIENRRHSGYYLGNHSHVRRCGVYGHHGTMFHRAKRVAHQCRVPSGSGVDFLHLLLRFRNRFWEVRRQPCNRCHVGQDVLQHFKHLIFGIRHFMLINIKCIKFHRMDRCLIYIPSGTSHLKGTCWNQCHTFGGLWRFFFRAGETHKNKGEMEQKLCWKSLSKSIPPFFCIGNCAYYNHTKNMNHIWDVGLSTCLHFTPVGYLTFSLNLGLRPVICRQTLMVSVAKICVPEQNLLKWMLLFSEEFAQLCWMAHNLAVIYSLGNITYS